MNLISVYNTQAEPVLYELLRERTPGQSISHKGMPAWDEHVRFVRSKPYHAWLLIEHDGIAVGSVYVTHQNEIGIFIFNDHRGHGYGKWAVQEVHRLFPGPHLANINPSNDTSRGFFEGLGAKLVQVTYQLGST
tara:strand:- start:9478 stop:9879 length:402 start_codon:yes stop_codon:yes gene_type:complete